MEEGKRVLFARQRIVVLVVLVLLCGLHICNLQNLDTQRQWRQYQDTLLERYQGWSLEEAQEDLNVYTQNGSYVTMEHSAIYRQVKYQLGFPDYLAGIQAQAERMSSVSIFSGSKESQENIRKTAADYARLEGVELTLGHDDGVNGVLYHTLSDYLLCAYILVVVYSFLAERKRGLWNMVSASPHGRMRMAFWRLLALAGAAVLGSTALTAAELIGAYGVHGGWQELGRSAQSVAALQNWTLPTTIGQVWLVYLLLRIACAFLLGCLAWFVLEVVADRRLVPLAWAVVVAVEYGLSRLPERSLLRIINVFTYLSPRTFLLEYRNITFLGRPAGQIALTLGVGFALCVLMLTGIFLIYRLRKPVESYGWLDKAVDRVNRFFAPLGNHCSLFGQELYKNLVTGRGWMVLTAALMAGILLASPSVRQDNQTSTTLESYYRQSQGPVNGETDAYLENRQARLDEQLALRESVQQQYAAGELTGDEYRSYQWQFSELDNQVEALEQYRTHLEELKQTPGSYVVPHWVYGMLLGQTGSQTNLTVLIGVVAVILLFFAQAGAERRTGMLRTRRAAPRGRRESLLQRHCAAWLVTALFSGIQWTVYILRLRSDYGELPCLEAPVRCLTYFHDFPGNLSILGFYLLLCGLRTLLLCVLASLVLAITEMGAVHGD